MPNTDKSTRILNRVSSDEYKRLTAIQQKDLLEEFYQLDKNLNHYHFEMSTEIS